jgi:hypothetical protein
MGVGHIYVYVQGEGDWCAMSKTNPPALNLTHAHANADEKVAGRY